MQLPTKVSLQRANHAQEPSSTVGLWLVGASGFLALRMTCIFKGWRVQGPSGVGHTHGDLGSRDFPVLIRPPKTDLENQMNRAAFCEPAQLLWTSGALHKDTAPQEATLAVSDQDCSPGLSWELTSSAQFSFH